MQLPPRSGRWRRRSRPPSTPHPAGRREPPASALCRCSTHTDRGVSRAARSLQPLQRRQGVPREAFQPGYLAFPRSSAPARAPRPLFYNPPETPPAIERKSVSCLSSGAGQKRGCPARPRAWTGRTTPPGPSMGCMASDGPPPAPIASSPRPPGPVPSGPPSRQLAGTADLTGPLVAEAGNRPPWASTRDCARPQAKLGDGAGVPGIHMLWSPRQALLRANPPPERPGAAPPSPRTPAPNKIGIRP